jgi:hypothetical protein
LFDFWSIALLLALRTELLDGPHMIGERTLKVVGYLHYSNVVKAVRPAHGPAASHSRALSRMV